jgi:hypothetical protein
VQQYHAIPSFFSIYNQLKWRKSNQKQVGSRRRKTKKVQDALHDAVATDDDDVECPTPIDTEPELGQPKALWFTQEMTPYRLDAITVMDMEIEKTPPTVGSAVAIGDNSPFAIANKKNENPHINDGDKSTVPEVTTDDDGLSNDDIPR